MAHESLGGGIGKDARDLKGDIKEVLEDFLRDHAPEHTHAVDAHLAHFKLHTETDAEQTSSDLGAIEDETIVLDVGGWANNEDSDLLPDKNITSESGNDSLVGGESESDGNGHFYDIIVQNGDDDTLPFYKNEASESADGEDSVTLIGVPASDVTNDLTPFDIL